MRTPRSSGSDVLGLDVHGDLAEVEVRADPGGGGDAGLGIARRWISIMAYSRAVLPLAQIPGHAR
jgi:hypothetical protein